MNSIDERREEVKKLVEEENSNQEIAEKLNIKKGTVANDIHYLKKLGKLPKKTRDNMKVAERRKQVKELVEEGWTNLEIAKELNIKKSIVASDICYLKKLGELLNTKIKRIDKKKVAERRKQVKELVKKGWTNLKIAVELGTKETIVANDIRYLRKSGELLEARKNEISKKVAERRKQVEELVKKGWTNLEIAKELEIKKSTVANDIAYLKKIRKLEDIDSLTRKEDIIYVRNDLKGESQVNHISLLLNQEVKTEETEETEKNISSMEKSNKFKKIINRMKQCNNIQDAINYAESFANSIYLSNDERNKLKEFIIRAESYQKKEILRLCKKENTIEEIISITKYSEGMITRIYRNYQENQEYIERE